MTMHLLIKTDNITLEEQYTNHSHYHEGDSGLDLFCPENILVKAGETVKIDLQIQCEALKNNGSNMSYYLYSRSSIVKTPLRLANSVGIIDAGYRGNIMAYVDNIKTEDYIVERGTRLFQICSGDLSPLTFEMVNQLSETTRGIGGFGSTDDSTNDSTNDSTYDSTNNLYRSNGVDYEQEPEPEPGYS